jgi:hypothetical protein
MRKTNWLSSRRVNKALCGLSGCLCYFEGAYHGALGIVPRAHFWFFFLENQFSPETRTIDASFWRNPRSDSPWKRAILEIGLTLFLGSDSCSPYSHTNTDANHPYLVRDSVACANHNCVLAIVLFQNAENPLRESPKTNGMGPKFSAKLSKLYIQYLFSCEREKVIKWEKNHRRVQGGEDERETNGSVSLHKFLSAKKEREGEREIWICL